MNSVWGSLGAVADLLIACIFIVMLLCGLVLWKQPRHSALKTRQISEISAGAVLLLGIVYAWNVFSASQPIPSGWLQHGELQAILIPYVILMGVLVKRFAYSYLQSDLAYSRFFMIIKWLVASLVVLITANHMVLQWLAWVCSGWLMYALLRHTQSPAAKQSARLSIETFMIGDGLCLLALCGLCVLFQSPLLSQWAMADVSLLASHSFWVLSATLIILAMGLFTKLSCLPFQTWLPQTLTAPTPVSALMHAGFVNAGAIILAKLSGLIIQLPVVSYFLIIVGLLSALYGSLVMLVQADVKRYLTYSTIGQMGFMVLECGLGAYHLALAHLMIHGFFKARLFLNSGSVVDHRTAIRHAKRQQPSLTSPLDKLGHLLILTLMTAGTWWAAHGFGFIGPVLDHLPLLLVTVIVSALLITQQTIIRVKGLSVWSITMAFLVGLALLLGYGYYEVWANSVLPHYNVTHYLPPVPVYWVLLGSYLLVSAGVVLQHAGIGFIPSALSRKLYMLLRTSHGITFSHR